MGVISCTSPVYDIVNKYILTLAIPLLLFSANIGEILRKAGKMTIAFVVGMGCPGVVASRLLCISLITHAMDSGACGTLLGTVVAFWCLNLGAQVHEAWKIAASLCARHIG